MRWPAVVFVPVVSFHVLFGFVRPSVAGAGDDAPAASYLVDQKTEYRLYLHAAEQGDPGAQALIGGIYVSGQGVRRDYAEAAKWYRMAAEQGHAGAQYELGMMYDNGKGVDRNSAEAAEWYRKAADQGHADAQYELGSMYDKGRGVGQDRVLAHMWIDLAASRFLNRDDREMAAADRDRIASGLTPAQRAEAQRLAQEWKAKQGE